MCPALEDQDLTVYHPNITRDEEDKWNVEIFLAGIFPAVCNNSAWPGHLRWRVWDQRTRQRNLTVVLFMQRNNCPELSWTVLSVCPRPRTQHSQPPRRPSVCPARRRNFRPELGSCGVTSQQGRPHWERDVAITQQPLGLIFNNLTRNYGMRNVGLSRTITADYNTLHLCDNTRLLSDCEWWRLHSEPGTINQRLTAWPVQMFRDRLFIMLKITPDTWGNTASSLGFSSTSTPGPSPVSKQTNPNWELGNDQTKQSLGLFLINIKWRWASSSLHPSLNYLTSSKLIFIFHTTVFWRNL